MSDEEGHESDQRGEQRGKEDITLGKEKEDRRCVGENPANQVVDSQNKTGRNRKRRD